MSAAPETAGQFVYVQGAKIELLRQGAGRPLLFLHPEIGLSRHSAALDLLARRFDVLAPSHPGYGRSDLPPKITTVDDLSYFYLDLIESLALTDVVLVGVSLGGWIAAEIATKSCARISHLVLANPAGIKTGGREHRDMVDIFSVSQHELDALWFHDKTLAAHFDPQHSEEEEILIELRNRESTGRFAWSPYMHNPKLSARMHRIAIPTLVLWGESDRIAPASYGRTFSELIKNGRFSVIPGAGRFAHIEQPQTFTDQIITFTNCH